MLSRLGHRDKSRIANLGERVSLRSVRSFGCAEAFSAAPCHDSIPPRIRSRTSTGSTGSATASWLKPRNVPPD